MQNEYIYIGIFVDEEEVLEPLQADFPSRLERQIKNHHCTLAIYPQVIDTTIFGTEVEILVTGYGCDGENEAVAVEVSSENAEVAWLCNTVKVPHITISVSDVGLPKNSAKLTFQALPKPYKVKGVVGGFSRKGEVVCNPIDTYDTTFTPNRITLLS